MTDQLKLNDSPSKIPWLHHEHPTCDTFRAGLSDSIQLALAGKQVDRAAISLHLESCSACAWFYIELLDLMTATHLQLLMDNWIEPQQSLTLPVLHGLLALWQMQLNTAIHIDDPRASARGLSIIGVIQHYLGDIEETRLIHQLALNTAEESPDLFSQMISHADLGHIALFEQQIKEALGHLRNALQNAKQLTDHENEARIHILLGQAWEQQHKWGNAQNEYLLGQRVAAIPNTPRLREMALARERKVKAILDVINAWRKLTGVLSHISGEITQPIRSLQEAMNEVVGSESFLEPQSVLARLNGFYDHAFQLKGALAPGGERVLVSNTAEEIPVHIVSAPQVNRDGFVKIAITIDQATLAGLPKTFFIDLLFLPANEILCTVFVGPEQMFELQMLDGLEIKAELPHIENFREQLRSLLNQLDIEHWQLPITAFLLHIWWNE